MDREHFEVVTTKGGVVMARPDGSVLLRNLQDNTGMYVKLSKTEEDHFGIQTEIADESPNPVDLLNIDYPHNPVEFLDVQEMVTSPSRPLKAGWCRNATLMLISLFAENVENFKSTIMTNEKVWESISAKLVQNNLNFTGAQCKDKFKYLKMRYMKKVDNMKKDKNSGAAAVKCDFFEELDELFRKKPNVTPIAIASSSRGMCDIVESVTDDNEEPPIKKACKRNKASVYREEEFLQREEAKERRHKERQAMQQQAIDSFNSVMQEVLKTFNRP